ncbi:MAG: two-component sensor histidine kinase [Actinobacteria bacterium]|nr:two-component sensor histidine kinase [Actinomycetota bacterium]
MTPFAAALLGLVSGAGLGALAVWLGVRHASARTASEVVARQQLTEILAPLAAAVVVVTAADTVLAASSFAKACGLARGSSIGPSAVVDLLAEARASGRPVERDLRLPAGPSSPAVQLDVKVVPLSNGAAVVVGEDRSADLRFSETRRDFVANITHELKTPIGAITLLAEAADAAADEPDAVRAFLGKLMKEARRLNELVSQIIALSRLQAQNPLLAAHEVDVQALLEASVARCREIAAASDVALSMSAPPGLTVLGDAEELETAVTNLVQNAIAYSEPGARVAVSSQASGSHVDIRVSDNGIGISDADQKRIFERFYRVDAGRSRASGGTGLGLSIVKHVAQAHGGEVAVWSRLGQGSTFTLRLPASQEGAPAWPGC